MKSISLKQKLQFILLGLSVIVITFLALIAYRGYSGRIAGKQEQVKAAADTVLDKIDRNLFERYGDVQAFALSEPARSGNRERIQSFMDDMMSAYAPIYDMMIVTNKDGKVIAVNGVDKKGAKLASAALLGTDYSGKSWFKAAMSGEVKAGTAHVEDLQVDSDVAKIANNDGRVMNFTAPIRDAGGKIVGVWTNRMSWNDVVVAIVKEESTKLISDSITAVSYSIISSTGTYLMHPEGSSFELKQTYPNFSEVAASAKKTSIVRDGNYEGKGRSAIEVAATDKGYSSYPGKDWLAIVQVPTVDAAMIWDRILIAFVFVIIVSANVLSTWFVVRTSRRFEDIIVHLSRDARDVTKTSKKISDASVKFANSSTQQAAAIEETVSSMEEMSSMLAQTSQHAAQSLEIANHGCAVANEGQRAVTNLSNAMGEIEHVNIKLDDLVRMIGEISDKTKVINDIVSETRLLSFNASIEAARAGAHGRGFAVVAEEVGKLASMSGQAAEQIRGLLESSSSEVAAIVRTTQERVKAGKSASAVCEEKFNAMSSSLEKIKESVNMITSAAREQEIGVKQTNEAMNEMDRVTQLNARGADDLADQAKQLSSGADSLDNSVESLTGVVMGEGNADFARAAIPSTNLRGEILKSSAAKAVLKDSSTEDSIFHSHDSEPETESTVVASAPRIPTRASFKPKVLKSAKPRFSQTARPTANVASDTSSAPKAASAGRNSRWKG